MTIDGLAFLGESIFGGEVTAEGLLARLGEAGVERAVVCPMKPPTYHLRTANDAVAEAVRDHSGILAGLVRVDPLLRGEAALEAERGLAELGLRGVFLHPWEETFRIDERVVDEVVEVARSRSVPVVVAAGYPWLSEGLQVGELAARFPEVTFVATNGLQINMSGLGQTDAELALAENPNLLIQTAGVYREDFIERVVEQHGPERVLFASSFPQFDPWLEVLRLKWAALSEDDRAATLHGNAERLFF